MNILVINPGSTSTKISFFEDEKEVSSENVIHSQEELKSFGRMAEQFDYRYDAIMKFVQEKDISLKELNAVVARGGLMKPLRAGTYVINEDMIDDLLNKCVERWDFEHPSNLAAPIAYKIGNALRIPSFIVDPIVVDEMSDVARISGVYGIERKSTLHALNLRAVGRIVAKEYLNSTFEKVNLIGTHMGGGISVVAFQQGKAVDVNRGAMGYGPFSPQRAGTLAIADIMELCFSGKYNKKSLMKKLMKESGLTAYLGTDDCIEIEKKIAEGNEEAKLIYEAMVYQIAKEIGSMATVLKGSIDGIYITGGLANSEMVINLLKERVGFIGKFFVYPSQNEMFALATGALRVLRGEEKGLNY